MHASAVELDHVIFFCGAGAPEAEALLSRGLQEGSGNRHPGQGTINRRFFFGNVYLELLWVENFAEAQRAEVLRTGLWERWQSRATGGCPFGLVFRPRVPGQPSPFPSWSYVPQYFPAGFSIDVALDIPASEPLLFYLPFARSPRAKERDPVPGGAQVGTICATTLHLMHTGSLSPALESLLAAGVLAVEPGQKPRIDLEHVLGSSEIIDLRPILPLRFLPATLEKDAAN
jgi:hypothetical protein